MTLRKILNIVTAKTLQKETYQTLSNLITKHNKLYLRLTKRKFTFKLHMLTHYPRIFKQSGPLHLLSSIRFEAKHQVFKISANSNRSRVNILISLATKYQISLAYTFLNNKIVSTDIRHGKKTPYIKNIYAFDQLKEFNTLRYFTVSSIDLKGITYKKKSVIVMDSESMQPTFGHIVDIIISENSEIFLVFTKMNIITFNEHYHSYEVEFTEDIDLIRGDKLYCYVK